MIQTDIELAFIKLPGWYVGVVNSKIWVARVAYRIKVDHPQAGGVGHCPRACCEDLVAIDTLRLVTSRIRRKRVAGNCIALEGRPRLSRVRISQKTSWVSKGIVCKVATNHCRRWNQTRERDSPPFSGSLIVNKEERLVLLDWPP